MKVKKHWVHNFLQSIIHLASVLKSVSYIIIAFLEQIMQPQNVNRLHI